MKALAALIGIFVFGVIDGHKPTMNVIVFPQKSGSANSSQIIFVGDISKDAEFFETLPDLGHLSGVLDDGVGEPDMGELATRERNILTCKRINSVYQQSCEHGGF